MNKELPPKPPGSNWTREQWEAICRGDENILVAAGAGSGKTRVLVERIIRGLLDEENPVDLDRLLVVTFTNAAAAEMRQRIGRSLEEAIRKDPVNVRLRRQLLLLNRAPITTLHSFCREVLRTYYYLRDLDPASRILDETEGDLLRQDLIEEVLEDFFDRQDGDGEAFARLVETFSTDRGDQGLQRLIHLLYNFSRSHPRPERWLAEKAAAFALPAGGLEGSLWFQEVRDGWAGDLQACRERLEQARVLALAPDGPRPYLPNLEAELHMLARAAAAAGESWQALYTALQEVRFAALKPCRGQDLDPSRAAAARELRDEAKKGLAHLKDAFFQRPLRDQEGDVQKLEPLVRVLVELVAAFAARYSQAKAERNALDFSDLEHHALRILTAAGPDGEEDAGAGEDVRLLPPSQAALAYRQRFREVLVDEYQDTNEVQEAILNLLSRPREEGGNLFMVGDVKQSIYRFRLAEPGLFLKKYREYREEEGPGLCIDLSRNFRSRREILSAVNYLFRQLMDRAVGEIDYVQETALTYGASYPGSSRPALPEGGVGRAGASGEEGYPVEVLLISHSGGPAGPAAGERAGAAGGAGGRPAPGEEGEGAFDSASLDAGDEGEAGEPGDEAPEEDMETAALEGRLIARKIRELMGCGPAEPGKPPGPALVFDRSRQEWRPLAFRDMVILLRSAESWAPPLLEELKRAGIPAYAEGGSGYFAAVEVEVMLSLLKIIDNPYQDIPLAAVLRSPLAAFSGEELGQIRALAPREPFYEALKKAARPGDPPLTAASRELGEKAREFLGRLKEWQRLSREGALADLIWQIYGETGYYELVGGMPGGGQRQANLRALYDRARQYENTSYRGLLRFLRFVEKLKERGGDLGVPRTLGEQEDVVRVMTIHKSKGLEFPVVFLAGLGKRFNLKDLHRDFLLHKDLGFGPRFLDRELKVSYPTLPFLAVRKRLKLELLAEEMRILYVALTRAEERLYLVATLKNFSREARRWALALPGDGAGRLPAQSRSSARGPLDWLGPALLRHGDAAPLRAGAGLTGVEPLEDAAGSRWSFHLYGAGAVAAWGGEETVPAAVGAAGGGPGAGSAGSPDAAGPLLEAVAACRPLPLGKGGAAAAAVASRLSWLYPHRQAAAHLAKMSVSELKRRHRFQEEEEFDSLSFGRFYREPLPEKPRFLEGPGWTAAERGTAYHAVLQYLDLQGSLDEAGIRGQLEAMQAAGKITAAEGEMVAAGDLAAFFAGPLGRRLLKAREVWREQAFSLALTARELYPDWNREEEGMAGCVPVTEEPARTRQAAGPAPQQGPPGRDAGAQEEEKVLIQGVLDCLFRDDGGLVLVDFKTDRTAGLSGEELQERYRVQLDTYGRAVAAIWREDVAERYLYFFDGGLSIPL